MSRRVTRAELSRHLKVNRATVTKWVKSGRLALGADGRVDLDDALRQLDETESPMPHHQARKAQIEAEKEKRRQADMPASDSENTADVAMRLKLAMAREREAKAAMAEMERARKAGELVRREDMEFILRDFGATLRQLLESMADRLAGEIAGLGGDVNAIHASLEQTSRDLLEEMHTHMQRRQKEHKQEAA